MRKNYRLKVWIALSLLIFLPSLAVIISQAYAAQQYQKTTRPPLINQHNTTELVMVNKTLFDLKTKLGQGDPAKLKLNTSLAPPAPAIQRGINLPLHDGVEDYDDVDAAVKRGVSRMGAWLISEMGIQPVITSGRRSEKNNKLVNGSPRSWHLIGKAVDLGVGNLTPIQQAIIRCKALEMGFEEVLYHDAGEGLHLHLANMTQKL